MRYWISSRAHKLHKLISFAVFPLHFSLFTSHKRIDKSGMRLTVGASPILLCSNRVTFMFRQSYFIVLTVVLLPSFIVQTLTTTPR